jgi:hypothetical protein
MAATEIGSADIRHQTARYQVPRAVLIWTWWKRIMLRPRTLIALSIWLLMAVAIWSFFSGDVRFLAIIPLVFVLIAPINVYQLYARAVDSEPQLTDLKTIEFSKNHFAAIGPDWRNETAWRRFKGFSENDEYFLLNIRYNNLAAIIPKKAFTPEQETAFRQCLAKLDA